MRAVTLLLLGAICALAASCSDPVYDDDLGIQAIPVEAGELEGTFGYKSVSAVLITVPVPGFENTYGGTENYRLVQRTWDAAAGSYTQTTQLCGGEEYEVAGVIQTIPEATFRRVPASTAEAVTVDHGRGTFAVADQVQVWGAVLPDPVTTELPEDAEQAALPPHVDRIYDMDEDGNPGFTTRYSGLFTGALYSVQRRVIWVEGITLGPERLLGLIKTEYDAVGLGGEFEGGEERDAGPEEERERDEELSLFEVHPDPKESWFEEVRLGDDATCDDVMALEAEGRLSRIRPF
jgi:hypothetical protein